MFCIVAFVILSILGIFSATNRQLAKEALDCVFRRVTLRPCNTGFDEKMKAKILGSVINRSETAARIINKSFEPLSWVFFVLLLGSSIWSVRGLYLFYVSGSCNGLNQTAFCVLDPTGKDNQVSSIDTGCPVTIPTLSNLTLNGVNLTGFPVKNATSKDKIVFIGSYGCDYTRATYPLVRSLAFKYNISFTYLDYPVKEKTDLLSRVGYCVVQQNPDAYWKLNDLLFATDKANLDNATYIQDTLTGLGLDVASINLCAGSQQTQTTITNQLAQVKKTNFFGTPTVFINGTPLMGPKPYRVYAIMLRGLWYW
jgi:protein-disulfide isomerase